MLHVVTGLTFAVGAWLTVAPTVRLNQPRPETIRTEFRVFDGATDVSTETRLRVRPSGSTETGRILEGSPLAADLHVVSVRWAEKLVVMAYPDERGRHLEVINFANEHGALQLRWPEGQAPDPAGVAVTVTKDGESHPTPARTIHGLGYALLILPAGTYDVRITRTGKEPVVLSKIELPADHTRMKVIQ